MATSEALTRPGSVSDLQPGDVGVQAPKKASRQILRQEIEEGIDALDRPAIGYRLRGPASCRPRDGRGAGRLLLGPGRRAPAIGRFLLWATLGNIVGGVVFVAALKYGLARPEAQTSP